MDKKKIVFFVARIGGWDGIALQATHWLTLLESLGYDLLLVTGEIDTSAGPLRKSPYDDLTIVVEPYLSIEHQGILVEKAHKDRYQRDSWLTQFLESKKILKKDFQKHIEDADLVFMHNFSIKHLIPSAWAAMYEVIEDNPNKRFINIGADSPFERGEFMSRMHEEFTAILKNPSVWSHHKIESVEKNLDLAITKKDLVLPGPDNQANLDYVVLNNKQSNSFSEVYGIDSSRVHVIPDMEPFDDESTEKIHCGDHCSNFFEFIRDHQVASSLKTITKNTNFIISPVRTVDRKKLLEVIVLTAIFRKKHKDTILVLTHPNLDGRSYYRELVDFAQDLSVPLAYLGDSLMLRASGRDDEYIYEDVMKYLSHFKSVSVVASEFGGWENGILEATQYSIPVCMNKLLPSYVDMESMGYKYIGIPVSALSEMVESGIPSDVVNNVDIRHMLENLELCLCDDKFRSEMVESNLQVGVREQSLLAACIKVKRILK
jgi:hypothetical protein